MKKTDIKIIAIDMDGTLLNEEKQISQNNISALKKAIEKGVEIVPATGRAGNGIPQQLLDLNPTYAITANGARVMNLKTGECIFEKLLPRDIALKAYDILIKYDLVLDLFQNGVGISTKANMEISKKLLPENILKYVSSTRVIVDDLRAFVAQQENGIEKWTMFFSDETQRDKAWHEMEQMGLLPVSSLPRNMELSHPETSKGVALEVVAKACGLTLSHTMAIGDGGNDLEMVEMAGIGIAMENGMENVKAVADFCTDTNDNDGVAKAIEKFVL